MCGRYTILSDTPEMQWLLNSTGLKAGDVYPTNYAPVLLAPAGQNHTLKPFALKWGFPGFKGSSVIINARSETAAEKPLFRKSLQSGRCVIPSSGFYEWDKDKNKFLFNITGGSMLYMAGIFRSYGEYGAFVILTAPANSSMEPYHNRMPVVLLKDECSRWIYDNEFSAEALSRQGPELKAQRVS